MTTVVPTWCRYCSHLRTGGNTCDAFPSGIPEAQREGAAHSSPVPGDNGIMFALHPSREDAFFEAKPYLPSAVETVG